MLGILFFACNNGELTAFPSQITWGEIDFTSSMPEEGYDAQNIALNNTGTSILELTLQYYDDTYLCLDGLEAGMQTLGKLEPEHQYSLLIGVCNYEEDRGERDTEISGTISVTHTGANSPVEIPWSFTPVLLLE